MTSRQLHDKIMQRKFELLQTTGLLDRESLVLYLDKGSFSRLCNSVYDICNYDQEQCSTSYIFNGMNIFVVETKEEHINVCVY